MSDIVKVTFSGVEYALPRFKVRQMRRIGHVYAESKPADIGYDVLAVAFQRADPPADIEDLEATPDEIRKAIEAVLTFNGFRPGEPKPESTT